MADTPEQNDPNLTSGEDTQKEKIATKELIALLREKRALTGESRDLVKDTINQLNNELNFYQKIGANISTLNRSQINTRELELSIKKIKDSQYVTQTKMNDIVSKSGLSEERLKKSATEYLNIIKNKVDQQKAHSLALDRVQSLQDGISKKERASIEEAKKLNDLKRTETELQRSLANLKSDRLKESIKSRLEQTSGKILNIEKSISGTIGEEYLKAQKQESLERKKLESYQKQLKAKTDSMSEDKLAYAAALQRNKGEDAQIAKLKQKLQFEKQIRDSIGITGKLTEALAKKLQLGDGAYAGMVKKARQLAEQDKLRANLQDKIERGRKIGGEAGQKMSEDAEKKLAEMGPKKTWFQRQSEIAKEGLGSTEKIRGYTQKAKDFSSIFGKGEGAGGAEGAAGAGGGGGGLLRGLSSLFGKGGGAGAAGAGGAGGAGAARAAGAAGAGGMAGGAAGLARFAGPVGVAVMVAKAIYDAVKAVFDKIGELAKKTGEFFKGLSKHSTDIASNTADAIAPIVQKIPLIGGFLSGTISAFAALMDLSMGIEQHAVNLGKTIGLTAKQSRELNAHFQSIAANNMKIAADAWKTVGASEKLRSLAYITREQYLESAIELRQMLEFNSGINDEYVEANVLLQKKLGLGKEESKALAASAVINRGIYKDQTEITEQIYAQTEQLKQATGLSVNFKGILKTASSYAGYLGLQFAKYPEKVTGAVIAAKALGMELSKLDAMGSSFLDFESSISKEFEAQLLTGKAINLTKARQAFLDNDLATAALEISKNVGTAADYLKMNRIAAESLASAMGMTRDSMADFLKNQELVAALGFKSTEDLQTQIGLLVKSGNIQDRNALRARARTEEQKKAFDKLFESTSAEKLSDTFEKIKAAIVDIVNKPAFQKLIEDMVNWLTNPENVDKIMYWVKWGVEHIISGLGKAIKFATSLVAMMAKIFNAANIGIPFTGRGIFGKDIDVEGITDFGEKADEALSGIADKAAASMNSADVSKSATSGASSSTAQSDFDKRNAQRQNIISQIETEYYNKQKEIQDKYPPPLSAEQERQYSKEISQLYGWKEAEQKKRIADANLQSGGLITKNILANIGEQANLGRQEAVIPLHDNYATSKIGEAIIKNMPEDMFKVPMESLFKYTQNSNLGSDTKGSFNSFDPIKSLDEFFNTAFDNVFHTIMSPFAPIGKLLAEPLESLKDQFTGNRIKKQETPSYQSISEDSIRALPKMYQPAIAPQNSNQNERPIELVINSTVKGMFDEVIGKATDRYTYQNGTYRERSSNTAIPLGGRMG